MSQVPPSGSEALSVVDRLAVRLLRIKAYGTLESARYDEAALNQWCKVLYDEERAEWQRVAQQILNDIARGDGRSASRPEYELREEDGATVIDDWYGDISEISADQARNPGSRLFRREVATTQVRSEWAEVTA